MKIYIVLTIALLMLSSCTKDDSSDLGFVQVREYQGKALDSVNSFRENSIKGPQYIDIDSYHLRVFGLISQERNYTIDELKALPSFEKVVRLDCVEGWSSTILWEGFLARDLLKDASPEANTVIFYAYDGYTTSFPLSYLKDNDIIIAYKMNNNTLLPQRGFPLQLVAESKWGYKWIKWITKIELSNNTDYQGYWEQRGYSDTGDLDKKFLK